MSAAQPLIAVLDDEPNMRVALGRLLRPRGYAVEDFQTGGELLEACGSKTFDCVILDLHMPVMDGFAVLEHLSLLTAPPPVIVITGHDQSGNAERASRLGASSYLTKPVDSASLIHGIEVALAT